MSERSPKKPKSRNEGYKASPQAKRAQQKLTGSKRSSSRKAKSSSTSESSAASSSRPTSEARNKSGNSKWSKPKNSQPLPKSTSKFKSKFSSNKKGPNKALSGKKTGSSDQRKRPTQDRGRKPTHSITLKGSFKIDVQQNLYFYPSSDNPTLSIEEENFLRRRVLVYGKDSLTAIHGDEVIAVITPSGKNDNYRGRRNKNESTSSNWLEDPRNLKAKVTKILNRHINRILGTYIYHDKKHFIAPEAQYLPEMEITHLGGFKPQLDDWVSVKIEKWEKFYDKPILSLQNIIKYDNPIELEELKVLARLGIEPEFNQNIQAELALITNQPLISDEERAKRDDFTKQNIITIDPKTAEDHDDAIGIEKLADNKGWKLWVHIADVSHLVVPGSSLDKEALHRGNSTYLPDKVLPMLPFALSQDLCSLKPDVERLTCYVELTLDEYAEVTDYKFGKGIINVAAKLSYEEAQGILDKPTESERPSAIIEVVQLSSTLTRMLRANRVKNGSLELERPSLELILDDKREVIGFEPTVHIETHELIEECMLLANETIATYMVQQQKACIYRVHDEPDPEKLENFSQMAKQYGYSPGDLTLRGELQRFLKVVKGSPYEAELKLALLKSLKRACYIEKSMPHYGLAKQHYTHFTSPIRRYADLVVHRQLSAVIETNRTKQLEKTPYNNQAIAKIAEHLSVTERNSSDAEEQIKKLKLLNYFAKQCALPYESRKSFEARIGDCSPAGIFIELSDFFLKGMVRRSDLPYNQDEQAWHYDSSFKSFLRGNAKQLRDYPAKFQAGDTISISIAHVDIPKRFLDFRLAD